MSVQFGRARRAWWLPWLPVVLWAGWVVIAWWSGRLAGDPARIVILVVPVVFLYWGVWRLDRAARVEPGCVILRTGRKEIRVPAGEVMGIRLEKSPGLLSRSVFVVIERGRFGPFEMHAVRASGAGAGTTAGEGR